MSQRYLEILSNRDNGIKRTKILLEEGELVALPTETVYGLAADARNDLAVAKVFDAKGRPSFNPLIVHVSDLAQVETLAEMSSMARKLAGAFWPGPLTMVLPLRKGHGLSALVSAGLPTVAIRMPAHPLMRAVLQTFGGPIAAPSANPSGGISATSAEHVADGLGDRIAAVLDGGPSAVGLESTILAPTDTGTRLLREGGLPREVIEPLTGPLIEDATPGKIEAPGQLSSHYAPQAPLRIGGSPALDAISIGFGDMPGDLNLSPKGDLTEAAANLFAMLHEADRLARDRGASGITVAALPETGLGRAINDRLRRAAAPRK